MDVPATLTLRDLATRINAHLKRFEREALLPGLRQAGACYMSGARVRITYVSRDGRTTMTRPKAEAYLAWLDAGNIGRHEERVRANRHALTSRLDGD